MVDMVDATNQAGIDFEHVHGGTSERYMVETMGSGLALADLDGDGWLDAYFVQQGPTPGFVAEAPVALSDRLFRSRQDGTFTDSTASAELDERGYGMGVAAGDYDNDGFVDLYVTNFGPNRLLRNNGDGTFSRAGQQAGVEDDLWGTSTAWSDIDSDGDLDLYVANYVDFGWDNHQFCGDARSQRSAYCHPDVYNALPDRLYLNRGDGTFVEIGEAAGIANTREGKGLGVVFGDFDDDGDSDIYVANDSTPNFLYINNGDTTFTDDAFLAGVGFNEDGRTEAGMGTDWGDFNSDGRLDVVVTNLTLETNTLYRNLGGGTFVDESFAAGIGEPSLLWVDFGTNWIDVDNDTDLDLFVANGHIIDNIREFQGEVVGSALENRSYPQANHLFVNNGQGHLDEEHARAGSGMALIKVSRGSAIGDLDNDGDLDVVVSNSNQTADVLRNDGDSDSGNWIQVRLVGRAANHSAAGARLFVRTLEAARSDQTLTPLPSRPETVTPATAVSRQASRQLIREVTAGSSYCSTSDVRLHVGLGNAQRAELSVRWPGGELETLGNLQSGRFYLVHEGRGVVASRPPVR